MIKRKGVCDVCTKEFELNDGSFAIRMVEEEYDRYRRKWTVTVLSCIQDAPEEGFSHVCGKTCLYRAMDQLLCKGAECRVRVVVDNSADEGTVPERGIA